MEELQPRSQTSVIQKKKNNFNCSKQKYIYKPGAEKRVSRLNIWNLKYLSAGKGLLSKGMDNSMVTRVCRQQSKAQVLWKFGVDFLQMYEWHI